MTTHARTDEFDGGWFTRCGKYTHAEALLSDEPTCLECRCWLGLCKCVGYHDWSARIDGQADG